MAESTEISWTKSTFNPWIGCQEAGPGCAHCYAKKLVERWGNDFAQRRRTAPANWAQVRRWNKLAPATEFAGVKGYWPVFCASLADIFDNQVPPEWRAEFWALVRECPNLTFLVVTKRIGNAKAMLPADWGDGYPNVVLIATVVNQEEVDRDVPKLLKTPAWRRGLSIEPILGPVDLAHAMAVPHNAPVNVLRPKGCAQHAPGYCFGGCPWRWRGLDWIIAGGESGPSARPPHPDWFRALRDQCAAAGVSFHFKQWGEWTHLVDGHHAIEPAFYMHADGRTASEAEALADGGSWQGMFRIGKKAAGRCLDHRTHDGIAIPVH